MTAQKQHGKESSTRSVYFQQVVITSNVQRHLPKILPKDTVVAVDKSKFYFGSHTTCWKDVDMLLLEDGGFNFKDLKEQRVMECKGPRGEWKAFRHFVERKWQKLQLKKDRELARERSNLPKASRPTKPRKSYGKKGKTYLTTSWSTRDDSEEEDDYNGDSTFHTKQTWKQKLQQKKELEDEEDESVGMQEAEDDDPVATVVEEGENATSDMEEDVPTDVQEEHPFSSTKTPKPKNRKVGKKLRKLLPARVASNDNFSDTDDEFIHDDPMLTTPAADAQVVTPAERHGRDGDKTPDMEAASSTKPKKGTLDSFFQPKTAKREVAVDDDNSDKRTLAPRPVDSKNTTISPSLTTLKVSPRAPFSPTSPKNTLTGSPLGNLRSPKATTSNMTNSKLTPSNSWTTTTPKFPPTTLSKSRSFKRSVCDIPDLSDDDSIELHSSPSPKSRITDSLSILPPPSNKRKFVRRPLGRNMRPRGSLLGRSDNSPTDNSPSRLPWREDSKFETAVDNFVVCPYRGLRNAGNSCYLNSSLQMLFTVKPFVDSLQGKGKALIESIVSTARDVADMTKTFAAKANSVKAALDKKTDKFRGTRQHDAHELVGELIDKIHEELEEARNETLKQGEVPKPKPDATTDDGKPKASTTESTSPGGEVDAMTMISTEPTEATPLKETDQDGGRTDDLTITSTQPTNAPPLQKTDNDDDGSRKESIEADESMALEVGSTTSVSTPTLEQADDDSLSKPLARKKAPAEAPTENEPTKEQLPTDEFFRCDIEVCLKCKSCGYSRTKTEMYRHLSLDIEHHQENITDAAHVSVKKCLERFFQEEEREIKCEKCENGETAAQTLRLLNRPRALLLHLKRFYVVQRKCDDGSVDIIMRKNKAQVELSKEIVLDSFRGNGHDWKAAEESRYSLRSLVYHVGDRASSGHYTAHAMRSGASEDGRSGALEWVSFDDQKTETADFEIFASHPFEQRNAYMLLYMLD